MQKTKPMLGRTLIILVVIAVALFTGCGSVDTRNTVVYTGGDIPADLLSALRTEHIAVIEQLQKGELPSAIIPFEEPKPVETDAAQDNKTTSQKGIDNNAEGNDIPATFAVKKPEVTLLSAAQTGQAETLAEVYVKFGKGIAQQQRIESAIGFDFALLPYVREMGVIFSTIQCGEITYLVKASYAKFTDDWQLYELQYGECAYENMTAPALYEKAVQLHEAKEYVPAAVYACLAGNALSPCGIAYPENSEISTSLPQIVSAVNTKYKFPFELYLEDMEDEDFDAEKAEPAILFGFEPVVTYEHGISMELRYFSQIDFRDLYESELDEGEYKAFIEMLGEKYSERDELTETQQLRQQKQLDKLTLELNEEMRPIFYWMEDNGFKGVTENFERVFVTAYNRIEVQKPETQQEDASEDKEDEKTKFVYFQYATEIEVKEAIAAAEKEMQI